MRALLLAALLGVPAAATTPAPPPQRYAPIPAQSSIGFSAEWNGATVQGRFSRFTADIVWADDLKDSGVSAVIDLASATTPDSTVNSSLPGDDWLASGRVREARFVARGFQRGRAPNSYVARGTLTMRGVSVPVELPFTVTFQGNTATMTGSTRLDRRAFKIGMQSDAKGAWVGFTVPVTIRIVARRAG